MNRKHFISSLIPLSASLQIPPSRSMVLTDLPAKPINPPYLKRGDIVGITCPAGYILSPEIQPAVSKLKEWGYDVRIGQTVNKKDFGFGGTDDERLQDLQQQLDDPSVKAILCARGGYGAIRIIDKIDFTHFKTNPKWIIGFSDITVLHNHINSNFNIASIHSKMCNSFPENWQTSEPIQQQTIDSIHKCLSGEKMSYSFSASPQNKIGYGSGQLVGGNLKTIETLAGSPSDLITKDKILFVEDTGEYLYSIDRMFWNLARSGKLKNLKGLVIGGFKVKPDDEGEEFGKTLEQIVLEKTAAFKYPVCFNFPVGHQKNNFALKCNMKHSLNVLEGGCSLSEIR